MSLGDGASAEDQLKAAERHGMDPAQIVVPLARALLLQGRFSEVLSGFDPEGRESTIAMDLRLLRAEAQAGLGQLAEARAAYEALDQDNDDGRIPLGLARIDLSQGKFDAVEVHAAAALALNPNLSEATLLRGEARRQKGDQEGSLPFYRNAINAELVQLTIRARAYLGLATALITLGRYADAEAELAELKTILPASPLGAYLAAVIKVRARDFATARNLLEGSAPTLENFVPAQFLFGIVYVWHRLLCNPGVRNSSVLADAVCARLSGKLAGAQVAGGNTYPSQCDSGCDCCAAAWLAAASQ
jgi:cellulose synthase operon protein C